MGRGIHAMPMVFTEVGSERRQGGRKGRYVTQSRVLFLAFENIAKRLRYGFDIF
jgi:hypothetical protein